MPNANITKNENEGWRRQYVDPYYGLTVQNDFGSSSSRTYQQQRSSTNTPDYRKWKLRYKQLPMRAFSFMESEVRPWHGSYYDIRPATYSETTPGVGWHRVTGYGYVSFQGFRDPAVSPFTQSQIDAADRSARTKLRLELKNQKINLAQAFAERKMTAELIGDTAVRIAKAITSLRRGNFVGAANALGVQARKRAKRRFNKAWAETQRGVGKNALSRKSDSVLVAQEKAAANGWLQLQYGWKPLLSDIYGAAEHLATRGLTELRGIAIARTTLKQVDRSKYYGTCLGSLPATFVPDCEYKYTVKYTVHYSTSDPGLHELSSLGITNPALVAWELLPFSFVVDWFLPIGNYLSSWDATLGLKFKQGCRTVYQSNSGTVRSTERGLVYSGTLYKWDQQYSNSKVNVDRTILTDFPEVALPSFKNPLSVTHMANGLALLSQIFHKK